MSADQIDEMILREALRKFGYHDASPEDLGRVKQRIAAMEEEEKRTHEGSPAQSSQQHEPHDQPQPDELEEMDEEEAVVPNITRRDPAINEYGEYLHQQRFKPYLGLERRMAAEGATPTNPRPRPQSHSPATRPRSARPFSSCPPVVATSMPPNRALLTRHASNVIYAFTDDRAYCSTTRGHPTPYQPRKVPVTDPVRRGQQMREHWRRDNFLTQKGRKDDLWEVRRSMLGVRE